MNRFSILTTLLTIVGATLTLVAVSRQLGGSQIGISISIAAGVTAVIAAGVGFYSESRKGEISHRRGGHGRDDKDKDDQD